MKWLRLYHDAINDPKWRLVALDSGQPLSAVLAVWMSMLINASQSAERGTLEGWDDRVAGAAIDLRADAVRCIREAMQGLTLDGFRLTGWEKRQRASDDIAGRVQRHRNKAKDDDPGGGSGNGLDQHRNDTPHRGNGTVTLQSADVTLHQASVTENPLRAQIQTKTSEEETGGAVCVASASPPARTHTHEAPPRSAEIIPLRPAVWVMPDDWPLPDDWREWALSVGHWDPDGAAEKFKTTWLARRDRGEPGAANSDAVWRRYFEGWINGDLKQGPRHGQHRGGNAGRGSYVSRAALGLPT